MPEGSNTIGTELLTALFIGTAAGFAGFMVTALFFIIVVPKGTFSEDAVAISLATVAGICFLCGLIFSICSPGTEDFEKRNLERIHTLQDAQKLSPVEFELYVKEMFEGMGYVVNTTQRVADGGIDLHISKNGATEIVQCKRYRGNVSVQVVREFFGVMVDQNVRKGYVVTTGQFTLPARKFAEGKSIHLIDGTELAEMMVSMKDDSQNC